MYLNTYYLVKPFMPYRVRVLLRRWWASRRRAAHSDTWPIDERAGAAPPAWPGWPEGKHFAVVLTHDVEGSRGLDRVESVMRLDARCGFRSSFNFVAEGEYRLPENLRLNLDKAGFEVAVHGLKHDGKLYSSRAEFARRAVKIRRYLREWNVAGFRSPLMHHRLGWLHELDLEYDASSFDTDPFEPESDGVRTIFPFWVPGPGDSGYVELPYTLVQDFNLFVILQERTTDLWKTKLDWIAGHGGMALVITHPDYMCFEGDPARNEYPARYYEEFLSYINRQYQGLFWGATPREVARYYTAAVPLSCRNTRRRICMVEHNYYESDNRVRRYAESLAKRGDLVDVIAVSEDSPSSEADDVSGVALRRIQRRKSADSGKWTYAASSLHFLVSSSMELARWNLRTRYDVIHVHNMPDFLVFAAWYPRWTGARVILDIHDLMPEYFASKFHCAAGHPLVKLLKWIEHGAAAFADHVIVSNHLWRETLVGRSVPPEKCSVFVNAVDPAVFYRRSRTRSDDRFVIIFPGSLGWHQGVDLAIEALARMRQRVPNAEFHIYSPGAGERELRALAERLGLNGNVKFCEQVPLERIPQIMADADLGVVPKRADGFGNEAYSTKIMEFMSQGLPVVVSRTKVDTFYFDENVVRFFDSGDSASLANEMLKVIEDQPIRDNLVAAGYDYVEKHSWDVDRKKYFRLVDSLSTETFDDLR